MWCAFLHADPGLSSTTDRVSIPPELLERAGLGGLPLPGRRSSRLGGAPGGAYGWCAPGGREDLSRLQYQLPVLDVAHPTGRSGRTTHSATKTGRAGDGIVTRI
ncbi:hypothetical protein F3K43_27775 [Streptomyces sp. LBUM 1476]|nr:hypothetical protein [Streptomyces sp. LBUM 1476]